MIWHKAFFKKKAYLSLAISGMLLFSLNCSILFLSPEKREIKEYLAQAKQFSDQKAYDQAIRTYESILKNYPENPWEDEVLFCMGCLYLYYTNPVKNFEKSKTYLERIIEDHPESSYLKATLAMLAVLNAVMLREKEIADIEREIETKALEIETLRQRIKSLQIDQFTNFISTAYEIFLREKELEDLNKKILNQKNALDSLQIQMKKIKEVDIRHEKKKSDEQN